MLKQSVFLYRTDVSLCLDTAVTTVCEKTFSSLTFLRVSKPHAQCLGVACPASSRCIFPELRQGLPFCGCAGQGTQAGPGLTDQPSLYITTPESTHKAVLHPLTQPQPLQKLLRAQLALLQWEMIFISQVTRVALKEWQVLAAECPVPLQQLSHLLPPLFATKTPELESSQPSAVA